MAAKRGRSSPSALDREIDRLTRRLNALVARRDSIVKAATPRTSPATSRRTGSVERRALRALHEARRGIPLFEAARNNGTTIAAIRRRVPGGGVPLERHAADDNEVRDEVVVPSRLPASRNPPGTGLSRDLVVVGGVTFQRDPTSRDLVAVTE